MLGSFHQPLLAVKSQQETNGSALDRSKHHSKKQCGGIFKKKHKKESCCKKTLDLLGHIDQTTKKDLVVDTQILNVVNEIENNVSCGAPISITQDMVTAGLTITEPGVYQFCENIVFSPASAAAQQANMPQMPTQEDIEALRQAIIKDSKLPQKSIQLAQEFSQKWSTNASSGAVAQDSQLAAITIDADNVIINLNGLSLSEGNGTEGVVGIEIIPGHKNITIQNGTITGFTAAAINAFTPETAPLATTSELNFINLTVIDNAPEGIGFLAKAASGICLNTFVSNNPADYATDFAYSNVTVLNCNINRNGVTNCYFSLINGLKIENSQINEAFAQGGFVPTIANLDMSSCANVKMLNSTFNNAHQGSDQPFVIFLINLNLHGIENAIIENCQFNDPIGNNAIFLCHSFGDLQKNFLWENCQFNGLRAGPSALLPDLFLIGGGPTPGPVKSSGIEFINCQFNDAFHESGGALGIVGLIILLIDDLVIEDCQFSHFQSDSGGCVGIYFQNAGAGDQSVDAESKFNLTIRNTLITGLTSVGESEAIIYQGFNSPHFRASTSAFVKNILNDNLTISKIYSSDPTAIVAGIISLDEVMDQTSLPIITQNLFIRNSFISDIRRTVAGSTDNIAGIYLNSVVNPIIENNTISDTVNGIVFTGTDLINPSNFFQLAASLSDAEAFDFIPLTSTAKSPPDQVFKNLDRGNSVTIDATTQVDLAASAIIPTTDLNTLGWQLGDRIQYFNKGGKNIGGLVTKTIYNLIVYSAGFTREGIIQDNKINRCSEVGYRDDATTTQNAWINNTAVLNGTNYQINWVGAEPIDTGFVNAPYPAPGNKYYNLSLE